MHGLAFPAQDVEGDELRRNLGGELADPALCRVQAQLHRVEVENPVAFDHDLIAKLREEGQAQDALRTKLARKKEELDEQKRVLDEIA